jgi:CDGSH-type Zn-finger protein
MLGSSKSTDAMLSTPRITILENGPYEVTGHIGLRRTSITPQGHGYLYVDEGEIEHSDTIMHLCRCGRSSTPPFCDGSHVNVFDGRLTASRAPFDERADVQEGPTIDLMDDGRCAFARFCHRELGDAWTLADQSDNPEKRAEAIEAACECPSGRLVAVDRQTGEKIEHFYPPEIDVLQDPERNADGPLRIKGNIELIGDDGIPYEARNRVALCRCGHSRNKPFCDAEHVSFQWHEEEPGNYLEI